MRRLRDDNGDLTRQAYVRAWRAEGIRPGRRGPWWEVQGPGGATRVEYLDDDRLRRIAERWTMEQERRRG